MPNLIPREYGWVELIIGPMFSGKTGELIRRMTLAQIAKQEVVIFKPNIDTRYSSKHIVSRGSGKLSCVPIHPKFYKDKSGKEVITLSKNKTVVGFDEAQFFNLDLIAICDRLAKEGKRVVVAGLDSDYARKPFETITQLVSSAEYVDKMRAICVMCGNPAHLNKRVVSSPSRVVIGDSEMYEARCRNCFWM